MLVRAYMGTRVRDIYIYIYKNRPCATNKRKQYQTDSDWGGDRSEEQKTKDKYKNTR